MGGAYEHVCVCVRDRLCMSVGVWVFEGVCVLANLLVFLLFSFLNYKNWDNNSF